MAALSWMKSAVRAPSNDEGRGNPDMPYTPEDYIENDMEQYRARFPLETKPLSDEELFNIVAEQDDDQDDATWRSLFSGKPVIDDRTPDQIISDALIGEHQEARAISLAAKGKGKLAAAIDRIITAHQTLDVAPFTLLFAAKEVFNADELASLPKPKSKTGNNPAIYKVKVIQTDGKSTEKDHNFYNVMADNSPRGNAAKVQLSQLKRVGDVNAKQDDIPQAYKEMRAHNRQALINRLDGEVLKVRAAYNKAFGLMFQMEAVNGLTGVHAEPIMALNEAGTDVEEDIVENTREPIFIRTTLEARYTKGLDQQHISIGTFMRLKTAVAAENGGTYAALLATIARKPKGQEQGSENKPDMIKTIEKYEVRVGDAVTYMDSIWTDKDRTQYQALVVKLASPAGALLLKNVGDMHRMTNDLMQLPKIKQLYDRMVMAEIDAGGEKQKAS